MTELLWVIIIDDNTVMTRKPHHNYQRVLPLDPEAVPGRRNHRRMLRKHLQLLEPSMF